ncbi:MAG: methyltransferase domain-containing protein [Myxococcales bacterium]|nr:methyltransferase domain-containing protein [Myxococcales bacterium]
MSELPVDHHGRAIAFGKTAADYEAHRPGFPASMFARLRALGWVEPGMRALDLGTGTGSLALELAANGLEVVGLDPSAQLLDVERLFLKQNPGWPKAGESGIFEPQLRDLDRAVLPSIESFSYVASSSSAIKRGSCSRAISRTTPTRRMRSLPTR